MTNLILVVDDDDLMRSQLCEQLTQAGYQVVEASNGLEAIATYTRLQPEIVLLDAMMPVMDGFSCCVQLQALPDGKNTPVLMITDFDDQETVERAFAVGATDFITKPIQWLILRQRLRRILGASQAVQELRQQTARETQLRIALDAAGVTIWNWDLLTHKITCSDNLEALFGLEKGTFNYTYQAFISCIHPHDRDFVRRSHQQAIQDRVKYDIEFRVRCKDDTYKWVLDRGQVVWDEDDNVVRMTSCYTDITERKQAEEQLRQSEERFQIVARATNDILWDWDLLTNEVWWNEALQTLFGYSKEQITFTAHWWSEHIHPDDRKRIATQARALIDSGKKFWLNEYRFRRSDGSYAYMFDRGYVVHDQTGKPVRMMGAMMDITERQAAQRERNQVQAELERQNMRSQLFANITLKIRQSLQIDEILQTSVTEVQKLLLADRVLILRLQQNGSFLAVQEAVVPGLPFVLG